MLTPSAMSVYLTYLYSKITTMNYYTCLLPRLFAIFVLTLFAGGSAHAFEGKIAMTMSTGKNVRPITYYVKGLHMRTEMSLAQDKKGNTHSAVSLFDMEAHQMLILMVEQKMYMSLKIPEAGTAKEGKPVQDLNFKPTGRKEKIAGYDTEEYAGESEGKRTEMWVTKELGQFVMANQGKPGSKGMQSAQWEKFMREGNFFAMRVIQRTKEDAPELFRMEVTGVEKTALPDSLFQPPADFKKLEIPDMGGMLKGMIPGN